jgi:glycosyltransferase involved in cell wall biosynthesis
MHVLTLTPFYPSTSDDAMGCFIAEPLRPLEELGIKSSVIAVQPIYKGRVVASARPPSACWVYYPAIPTGLGLSSAGSFLFASLLSRVRELHRMNPIDLIHAHAALPCGHAAALLSRELGIPFVVTVHGLDVYMTNQVRGHSGRWCENVSRMVYRSARYVICISEKVRDRVTENPATTSKTCVIYNGVDAQVFVPARDDCKASILLSVGNLIPIKGHGLLLQAFAALHKSHPEIQCVLIGDGPERARLGALANSLGISDRICFLGRRTRAQVAATMGSCVLFALPSEYEGLGCVYLEAMAAEKAVIACRGQGIEEIIQHGRNGWLIEPGDLLSLTGALAMFLENPELCRRIGAAARETVVQGFTLAHQAARLAELYGESIS